MGIKYKHTCLLNSYDTLEVEARIVEGVKTLCFTAYEDDTETAITIYLDVKTSRRLDKSINTEINVLNNSN